MFLRDFIVHSVLLSFCAVCITHVELLGMSSPKKSALTFPGIVEWFAKSTNTVRFEILLPFLFSSITVPMFFSVTDRHLCFVLSQPFLPCLLTFPFLCLCMITFFRITETSNFWTWLYFPAYLLLFTTLWLSLSLYLVPSPPPHNNKQIGFFLLNKFFKTVRWTPLLLQMPFLLPYFIF